LWCFWMLLCNFRNMLYPKNKEKCCNFTYNVALSRHRLDGRMFQITCQFFNCRHANCGSGPCFWFIISIMQKWRKLFIPDWITILLVHTRRIVFAYKCKLITSRINHLMVLWGDLYSPKCGIYPLQLILHWLEKDIKTMRRFRDGSG